MKENAFFKRDENGKVLLKLCKTADNQPYYLEVEPSEADPGEEYVKATKCHLLNRSCLEVFSLPGLPTLSLNCVVAITRNEIFFGKKSKSFEFDFSLLVEEKKTLFVQPDEYNHVNICVSHLFEADYEDIESMNDCLTFIASPSHAGSVYLQTDFAVINGHQVVLNESDGWMEKLSDQEKSFFAFERYFDATQNAYFLVSKPILNFSELLSDSSQSILSTFSNISLLKVKKSPSLSTWTPVYSFNTKFVGVDLILFPFISFVAGLAAMTGKFIYAKITHLTQSSGYGKTRLCFELLKYYKSGIYCVYREYDDFGFPSTRPWTQALASAFKYSRADDESILICLKFIKWAVVNFSALSNEHLSAFIGEATYKTSFAIDPTDKSTAYHLVTQIKAAVGQKNNFIIILDECHEFLRKPNQSPHLMSLYQAFGRAMNLIKASKVVAICVGTKSSLGEFVLTSAGKSWERLALPKKDEVFDVPVYNFTHSCNSMLTEPFCVTYENACTTKLIDGYQVLRSIVLESIALRCGRPLWCQYDHFIEAFEAANTELKVNDDLKEVVALIMRTGTSIVPQDPFAHQLVTRGLATLLHVDVNGSRCYVEYVPEPVLSNRARIMLTDMELFRKGLAEYVQRLHAGVFRETGTKGELVGRIALLRALDLVVLIPRRKNVNIYCYRDSSFKAFNGSSLIGSIYYTEVANAFADRIDQIKQLSSPKPKAEPVVEEQTSVGKTEHEHDDDKKEPDTTDHTREFLLWNPTMPISTVKQFLMMLSTGSIDDKLDKLGVSDDVLDGLVCFSQFVNLENPLLINQVYLMQAFARGCALILPERAPGADAVIPVLRKDNRMSCIVVRFKNFDVKTFPCDSAKVSSKLTPDYLSFLDWGAIGDFQAVDVDDFVRLVIQFGSEDDDSPVKLAFTKIPASNRYALWIRGLKALEHLFFADKEVLSHLNTILSGRRDFYGNLDYSRFPLPTYLQTTAEGARFLGRLARPLANYSNLIPYDAQMRNDSNAPEKSILDKSIKLMQLSKTCFDTFQSCKISPIVKETDASPAKEVKDVSVQKLSNEQQNILSHVVAYAESECGHKTRLSDYQRCLVNLETANVPHLAAIAEKFEAIKRPYREASEKIARETELAFRSPKPQETRPKSTRQASKNAQSNLKKNN